MCGIIGLFSSNNPYETKIIYKGMNKLKNRGNDAVGIVIGENIFFAKTLQKLPDQSTLASMGHCLHAVVNYIPQPIKESGVLVANCEIYNWKKLDQKYNFDASNDSTLLLKLIDINKKVTKDLLRELDGDYAFAYKYRSDIWLARDIIGVKPLWYAHTDSGFAFASERGALTAMDFGSPQELNPRKILHYNADTHSIGFIQRVFFKTKPELAEPLDTMVVSLKNKLVKSVKKRIPNVKFGLLFSGGIDSIILAQILKKQDKSFTCFVVGTDKRSKDLKWSKESAKKLNLQLEEIIITERDVKEYLPTVIKLIEDANVVKVEIGLTVFLATKRAQELGCKVILAGMGADELFGGYHRQRNAIDLNKDCVSKLRGTYEKNTYRDDVISMYHSLELRVPYLDTELITYALRIPSQFKIPSKDKSKNKYVLRLVGQKLGVPQEFVWRPKKAIQYGSRVDKVVRSWMKDLNIRRSDFFSQLLNREPLKLGALFSTGKDSSFALYIMKNRGYDIACLITMVSENPESYMFHTPAVNVAEYQAKSLDLPLIKGYTEGKKEEELKDLLNILKRAKHQFKLDGIITGALYSNYQRSRIEKAADQAGLKVFNPLWHIEQEKEMRQLLREKFTFIFTAVAAMGLDKTWLGRSITEDDVDKLVELEKNYGINVAGEGGEFESLVLDMPGFSKKIEILDSEIIETGINSAQLIIKKVRLKKGQ